jgi:hypothetical protein
MQFMFVIDFILEEKVVKRFRKLKISKSFGIQKPLWLYHQFSFQIWKTIKKISGDVIYKIGLQQYPMWWRYFGVEHTLENIQICLEYKGTFHIGFGWLLSIVHGVK